jgi:nitrate reductase alpha subunit
VAAWAEITGSPERARRYKSARGTGGFVWWDASYLILWGSNVPVTRTPDAHRMTEARYRGQKVVVCSPDYSDAAKFAGERIPAAVP